MFTQFLRSIRIIFAGIFMGPVIFLGIVLFLQTGIDRPFTIPDDPFLYVVIAAATVAIISATMLYRMRLPQARAQGTVEDKLTAWRTLFIVKLALTEGAILVSIVVLFLQEADIYVYLAAALIGVQSLNFPKESTIKSELDIN